MSITKKVSKTALTLTFALCSFSAFAEDMPQVKVEGYVDTYYAFDNDMTMQKDKDGKVTTLPAIDRGVTNAIGFRKNELNINTAQLTASVDASMYRGRVAVAYGTIPRQSWASYYFPLQEANAGIKLMDNLWLDSGVFLTHVGGESLLPKNNWISSLALTTMYEPFYQTGVKLSYKPVNEVEAQLHVLNGFGLFDDNNADKTLGWLFSYAPNAMFNVSWNGTLGNEQPAGSPSAIRFYNDINFGFDPTDKLGFRGELDFATEAGKANPYLSGLLKARYAFTPQVSLTARGEYINDPSKIVSVGLSGFGATLGAEYKPTDNSYVRLEGRQFMLSGADSMIFTGADGKATGNRLEGMLSIGTWF